MITKYYPKASPNGLCVHKVCDELRKKGMTYLLYVRKENLN